MLGSAPETTGSQEVEIATLVEWGQHYGLVSGESELATPVTRIDLAKMLTLFVNNVWAISIHENPTCDVTHYADYTNIATEDRQYVKSACDL